MDCDHQECFSHAFQLRELRTVDSLFIITKEFESVQFKDDKEEALQQLKDLVPQFAWETGLEVWQKYFSFDKPITLKPQSKNRLPRLVCFP